MADDKLILVWQRRNEPFKVSDLLNSVEVKERKVKIERSCTGVRFIEEKVTEGGNNI